MRSTLLALSLLVLGATACANRADRGSELNVREPVQHPEYGLISAQPVAGWQVFGADVPEGEFMDLGELLANADQHEQSHVLLEATIAGICQKKGCWMTLEHGSEPVRVRFQDYAFFVPKDAAGRTVRMRAWFESKRLSVEEVRHYLEDAGKHDEAARVTEPKREYSLYASGVRIRE